jgi:signal transduction histidine kinase
MEIDGGPDGWIGPEDIQLAVLRDPLPPPVAPVADPTPGPSLPADIRLRWVEFERSTSVMLLLVAVIAVVGASLVGLMLADRVLQPLRLLGRSAAAVAKGDLSQRSGLGSRRDEIGELGRSFDSMAAALEAADASRRRFLQDVVHELRTPLTVIDTTSSALLDGVYDLEPRHVETIRDQAHLLARIVDDLRTLNLAEVRKLPLELEPLDPRELLEATAVAYGAPAGDRGQQVLVGDVPTSWVLADPDRLRQVLAALVDNALRHAPEGGEVRLRAVDGRGQVRFEVEDTGPGVAPEDLDRVFDRFYEADPARDRAAGHSGLGLAIVKALIEAHGGRVGVVNAAGAGACFWFELPSSPAVPPESPAVGRVLPAAPVRATWP